MEKNKQHDPEGRVDDVEIAHTLAFVEAPYRDIAAIAESHESLPGMALMSRTSLLAGRRAIAAAWMAENDAVLKTNSELDEQAVETPSLSARKRTNSRTISRPAAQVAEQAQQALQNETWRDFARQREIGQSLELETLQEADTAFRALIGQAVQELQTTRSDFEYGAAWGSGLTNKRLSDTLRPDGFIGDLENAMITFLPTDGMLQKYVVSHDRTWPNIEAWAHIEVAADMISTGRGVIGRSAVKALIYNADHKGARQSVFRPRVNARIGKNSSGIEATKRLLDDSSRHA